MVGNLGNHDILIAIIGPSAENISGSLLRPLNIYYSLKCFRKLRARYVPIKRSFDLFLQLWHILHADIIIASGVNPWISAFITILGKVLKKRVVVDFHGFAWFEANVTKTKEFPIRTLLLISERVSYRFSQYVITASKWLANVLIHYFGGRKGVFIIENAVPYVFEKVANKLMRKYDSSTLRKYICEKVLHRGDCFNKLLLIAPLPSIFKSNTLAYEELLKLKQSLDENILVVVTGIKGTDMFNVSNNIVSIGYIDYVDYVALLLASHGVILPYPSNAICGGVRNKVLEAGFYKKPVISTKIGMMHFNALPMVHYIPINTLLEKTAHYVKKWEFVAQKLHEIVVRQHGFSSFKRSFLSFLLEFVFRQNVSNKNRVYMR
jgi:glycosyltransferase involved in cell wall biosynthesis